MTYNAKKSIIKNKNHITIHGWMINDLDLKGNDLIVYALIYGFSQDGESEFRGSLDYIACWCNATTRGIVKNIDNLIAKGLVKRHHVDGKGCVKKCRYVAILEPVTIEQSSPVTIEQSSPVTIEQSSPAYIYNDNIDKYNRNDNIEKIYKKEISPPSTIRKIGIVEKEDLEQIKENHFKEHHYSQEEEGAVREYLVLRHKQHKGLAKTERALTGLLNGIENIRDKGYDIVKVVKKLDRNSNVLQKHELTGRENLYKDCISDIARFNQTVAKELEKNKTKELQKAVKRKIENEKINQEVIDW